MCCQKCTLDLQERRSINGQRYQGLAIRTWQLTGSDVPKNDSHRAIHHCCKRCALNIGLQIGAWLQSNSVRTDTLSLSWAWPTLESSSCAFSISSSAASRPDKLRANSGSACLLPLPVRLFPSSKGSQTLVVSAILSAGV